MQTVTELALERAERGVFTRDQAALWVGSRGARLDALLKRAVASREVWRVHRGLYCLSDRYTRSRVNPLELAQRIHGPSYVSLETALSHQGWIPEGVLAVTSVALGRSRTFDTPVGLFSFTRVPQRRLLAGVRRVSVDGGSAYFLATPLKALADLVYVQRRDWHSAAPVVESLRVEDESLLCRNYLKGRDWYDFIWYTARRTPINHELLSAALDQQGPWMGQALKTDDAWCVEQLRRGDYGA